MLHLTIDHCVRVLPVQQSVSCQSYGLIRLCCRHASGAVVGDMLRTLRQEPAYRELLQWEEDGEQGSGDASGAGGGGISDVVASSSPAAEGDEGEDVGSGGSDDAVVGAIVASLRRLYDHLCAGRKAPGPACD